MSRRAATASRSCRPGTARRPTASPSSAPSRPAWCAARHTGPVPMKAVPPQVSTADAEARAGVAAMYLARPVTLRYRERTLVLSPGEMAGMLSVNTGADADTYPLTFRNERAAARLHELFSWAETPPVDARIEVHPEGGITVTPSKVGEVLDMKVLLEDLDDTALGMHLD